MLGTDFLPGKPVCLGTTLIVTTVEVYISLISSDPVTRVIGGRGIMTEASVISNHSTTHISLEIPHSVHV